MGKETTKRSDALHIKVLRLSDYRKIEELAIEPGTFNIFKGGNRQGKTSILHGIHDIFLKAGHSPNHIRLDQDEAVLFAELSSGATIERKQGRESYGTKVVDGGDPLSSPVAWLKSILGPAFAFDVAAFYDATAKEKRAMILKAVEFHLNEADLFAILDGLEVDRECAGDAFDEVDYNLHGLTVLDLITKNIYDRRAEANRTVDRLLKSVKTTRLELPTGFDSKAFLGFNVQDAIAELETANAQNRKHEGFVDAIESKEMAHDSLIDDIKELETQLKLKNDRLQSTIAEGLALEADLEKCPKIDTAPLSSKIAEHSSHLKYCNKVDDIDRYEKEAEGSKEQSSRLSALHKALATKVPQLAMSKLNLPVTGLEFDGDTIRWNRVDLDSLSTEEEITLGVQFARALSGRAEIICVDGWERLDDKSREFFLNLTKDDGFQYFVTFVTGGDLEFEILR